MTITTTLSSTPMSAAPEHAEVAELARRYGPQVYRVAHRMLGNSAQAEDVQQDVFLRLLEGGAIAVASWPAYLTTLATRLAIDRMRRQQRWRRLLPMWLLQAPSASASTESNRLDAERAEQLRQALTRLKARDAECFALRYLQGLEIAEVAVALGITPNLVSVILHRVTAALRQQFADSTLINKDAT
jgi:RNA polymerase sigma factor (sigma-70 family)